MSNSQSENTLGVPQRGGLRRRSVSLDTSELHRNQDFDQPVPDPEWEIQGYVGYHKLIPGIFCPFLPEKNCSGTELKIYQLLLIRSDPFLVFKL